MKKSIYTDDTSEIANAFSSYVFTLMTYIPTANQHFLETKVNDAFSEILEDINSSVKISSNWDYDHFSVILKIEENQQ